MNQITKLKLLAIFISLGKTTISMQESQLQTAGASAQQAPIENSNQITGQHWQVLQDISIAISNKNTALLECILKRPEGSLVASVIKSINDTITTQSTNRDDAKLIHLAAENGNIEIVSELLKKNPELISSKDRNGLQPIHYATKNGQIDIFNFLFDKDPNLLYSKTNNGALPIHYAARFNKVDIFNFLLDKDPNLLNAKTNNGALPIHNAILSKEIINTILEKCPSMLTAEDNNGAQPIGYAFLLNTELEIINTLVDRDANILKHKDHKSSGLIHAAAFKGNLKLFNFLLDKDSTLINLKDKDGKQPIHYAAENNNLNILKFLFGKNPALISATDAKGNKPIYYAKSEALKKELARFEEALTKNTETNISKIESELARLKALKNKMQEAKETALSGQKRSSDSEGSQQKEKQGKTQQP